MITGFIGSFEGAFGVTATNIHNKLIIGFMEDQVLEVRSDSLQRIQSIQCSDSLSDWCVRNHGNACRDQRVYREGDWIHCNGYTVIGVNREGGWGFRTQRVLELSFWLRFHYQQADLMPKAHHQRCFEMLDSRATEWQ